MVSEGFTVPDVGNTEPSQMKRLGTSCDRPFPSTTDAGVSAHPARAHEMRRPVDVVLAIGGSHDLAHLSGRVINQPPIVVMMAEKHMRHGQAVAVALGVAQLDPVVELRKSFADDADAEQ
jgi:hypothetical protein